MTNPSRLFLFAGGNHGKWHVQSMNTIVGDPLPIVTHLEVYSESESVPETDLLWTLRGITSNERYVNQEEKKELTSKQEGLGRPQSTDAALIPIRKKPEWWALTQQERREIFEESSKHIQIGMKALPAIARRLHHCRDLSSSEPFDFLTWFEFTPEETALFDQLLADLRATPEWDFVNREIDIRLMRS